MPNPKDPKNLADKISAHIEEMKATKAKRSLNETNTL